MHLELYPWNTTKVSHEFTKDLIDPTDFIFKSKKLFIKLSSNAKFYVKE